MTRFRSVANKEAKAKLKSIVTGARNVATRCNAKRDFFFTL